jgi:hypothetical protein
VFHVAPPTLLGGFKTDTTTSDEGPCRTVTDKTARSAMGAGGSAISPTAVVL